MSLPTVIVIVVVSRGDLDCPGTKGPVHHLVCNDGQSPVTEGMCTVLTNQVLKENRDVWDVRTYTAKYKCVCVCVWRGGEGGGGGEERYLVSLVLWVDGNSCVS